MSPWEQSCESRLCGVWVVPGICGDQADRYLFVINGFSRCFNFWWAIKCGWFLPVWWIRAACSALPSAGLPGPGLWKLWPAPRRGFNFSSAELLQCRAVTSGNTLNTHLSDGNSLLHDNVHHTYIHTTVVNMIFGMTMTMFRGFLHRGPAVTVYKSIRAVSWWEDLIVVLNTARDESWVLLPRLSPAQSASAPIQTIQIQSVNDAEKFDPSHENNNHCRPPAGPA